MKILKFSKIMVLFTATALVFSSCAWFEEAPPEEDFDDLLKDGVRNLSDVNSAEYSFYIEGELEADESILSEDDDFSVLAGSALFAGVYDVRDEEDILFSLDASLDFELDDELEENVSAEVRIVDNTLYMTLKELSDLAGELPSEMVEPFIGKWWSLDIPPEYREAFEGIGDYDEDEYELTVEEEQLKELFEDTDFFQNVDYLGTERVGGENCHKYFATLDEDATIDYMVKAGEIMETPVTQEEIEEFRSHLEYVDLEGYFWIGVNDEALRKFETTLVLEDVDGVSGTLAIALELSNLNEAVSVEAPAESEDFEQLMMMLLLGEMQDMGESPDMGEFDEMGGF